MRQIRLSKVRQSGLLVCLLGLLMDPGQAVSRPADPTPVITARPNVLFIGVDDLRPELAAYGADYIRSPNIDRLAEQGVVFNRAYAQWSICMQSRASMLSGLRPDTFLGQASRFRELVPGVVTLPQHFKNHGYFTRSFGKVFHGGWQTAYLRNLFDDPPSWSEKRWTPAPRFYFTPRGMAVARDVFATASPESLFLHGEQRDPEDPDQWMRFFVRGLATEAPEVADNVLGDGQIADAAIDQLRELVTRREATPFFLAVGFMKPHLPFVAPKPYWDLYDPAKIPPVAVAERPVGAPAFTVKSGAGELNQYYEQTRGGISPQRARHLRHGYAACVSYIDAQIGRLLDALEALGLADNTIVVLWSDHGFRLGDFGGWGKSTNFELDTRVPLIVRMPGLTGGGRSDALVELVDLHPTVSELAGLPVHPAVEGESFAVNVRDPGAVGQTEAFSQVPRGPGKQYMGYSVRTVSHRYTEWRDLQAGGGVVARELYAYDADLIEKENIADTPAAAALQQVLSSLLNQPRRD